MGDPDHRAHDPAMDEFKLPTRDVPAIRSFRICLDHPHQPSTILGIVRRVAVEQAKAGPTRRPAPLPRRVGAFA
jgi:hypothetical protein